MAVNDADARQAGEEGAVEIFFHFGGFVDGAADEVDLHAHVVGVGAGGDGDASALRAAARGVPSLTWSTSAMSSRLTRILMGPRATSKRSFSISRWTHGDLVHGLDADLVAGGDAEDVRLGVGVAGVGAGAVGDDGLVEALLRIRGAGG